MRTEFAILIGAGVLSLVVGLDSATPSSAASRHHARHARSHHVMQPPVSAAESTDMSLVGNNPARRASVRQMPAGAVTAPTLATNGNNPARRATTTGSAR